MSYNHFLESEAKKRRLLYERTICKIAFEATQKGVSAYRAAKLYSTPPTTLQDKTTGRVDVGANVGHYTFFTREEKQKL